MHYPSIQTNVATTLLRRAATNPDRTAVIFEDQQITYNELADRVRKQANLFKEHGICMGDRVGFLGFNQPAFLETMYAANAIGAIFVPLNFRLTAQELIFIINDAGIHSLVVDDASLSVVDPVREQFLLSSLL